ncbi:MAG: TorF family putative porin, partial [Acidobacteriota bacterium]
MRIVKTALTVVVAGLMSASALAQTTGGPTVAAPQGPAQAPAPAPEIAPAKRVTFTTGVDFTSAYLFRGILQHSGGTIAQPAFDVGIALGHGVSANVGNWDSVHSNLGDQGKWYESDYYGAVNFTAGKLKPGVLYTSYTSPIDGFSTVKELAGVLAFDDSGSPLPFSPKVTVAFELGKEDTFLANHGQADGGL